MPVVEPEALPAAADVAVHASGASIHEREVGNVSRHEGAGPHHRRVSDGDAGEKDDAGSEARAAPNERSRVRGPPPAAPGARVVREGDVRADEDVVFEHDAVIERDAALDRDAVADDHVVLDEAAVADVAVTSDRGSLENVHVGPYARSLPDARGRDEGGLVDQRHGDSEFSLTGD